MQAGLGSVADPVVQANGWLSVEDDLFEICRHALLCFTVYVPVSALSSLTVCSLMEVSIDGERTRCHFFISETKRDFD